MSEYIEKLKARIPKFAFRTLDGLTAIDSVVDAMDEPPPPVLMRWIRPTPTKSGQAPSPAFTGNARRYERTGERYNGFLVYQETL